ncbi:hypothetical protein [Methylobacterium sp. JK268]
MSRTALLSAPAGTGRPSLLASRPVLWGLVAVGIAGAFGLRTVLPVVQELRLPDTDDAMRLVEVRDFLAGQSWFDVSQHRLLPPGGASMHWSRLVDLPIAGLILALRGLVGPEHAEALAVAAWPPLLFGLYALLLLRGARSLFGERAALLALFVATQTALVTELFAPGRIDHHGVQICAILGLALRLMRPRPDARDGAVAGALAAFSLAVGLETLPFIAGAGLALVGRWILAGEAALGPFLGFAGALALAGAGLFGLQTAPALWLVPACDALSPPWLWCAAGAAATAAAARAASNFLPGRAGRLALAALGGILIAGGFALIAPACLQGPFAGMPEAVRRAWLDEVSEMLPLWRSLPKAPGPVLSAFMPELLGAIAAALLARRAPAGLRPAFGVLAGSLGIGAAIGAVQFRGLYVASGFVPLVAGLLLDRALAALNDPAERPAARFAVLAAGLGLIGKVWVLAGALPGLLMPPAPALADRAADAAGAPRWPTCTTRAAAAALAAEPPGTILAPVDLGPYLLLHTAHGVVAAPYHRDPAGIAAALDAFGGEAALRRVARAQRAAYIAVCATADGEDTPSPFIPDLARGRIAPSWLEPIPAAGSALVAWRVRPLP